MRFAHCGHPQDKLGGRPVALSTTRRKAREFDLTPVSPAPIRPGKPSRRSLKVVGNAFVKLIQFRPDTDGQVVAHW